MYGRILEEILLTGRLTRGSNFLIIRRFAYRYFFDTMNSTHSIDRETALFLCVLCWLLFHLALLLIARGDDDMMMMTSQVALFDSLTTRMSVSLPKFVLISIARATLI